MGPMAVDNLRFSHISFVKVPQPVPRIEKIVIRRNDTRLGKRLQCGNDLSMRSNVLAPPNLQAPNLQASQSTRQVLPGDWRFAGDIGFRQPEYDTVRPETLAEEAIDTHMHNIDALGDGRKTNNERLLSFCCRHSGASAESRGQPMKDLTRIVA